MKDKAYLVVGRTSSNRGSIFRFENFYDNGKIIWGFIRGSRCLWAAAYISGELVDVLSIMGGYLCRADSANRTEFDIECFVTLIRYRQVETYQVLAEKSLAALLKKERRKRRLNNKKILKGRRKRQRANKKRH